MIDLFRAAAEVGPHHILKMYNIKGNMVNISPQLEANSLDSYYRLEVVTSDVKGEPRHFSRMLAWFFEASLCFFCPCPGARMPTELENMETR